jgi:hypothetical protein
MKAAVAAADSMQAAGTEAVADNMEEAGYSNLLGEDVEVEVRNIEIPEEDSDYCENS